MKYTQLYFLAGALLKAEPLESTAGGFPQTPEPAFRHCVMGGYRYPISYPTQLATAVLKLVEKLGMFQIVKLINLVDPYADMLQERSIINIDRKKT